jgi:hypothetical protein
MTGSSTFRLRQRATAAGVITATAAGVLTAGLVYAVADSNHSSASSSTSSTGTSGTDDSTSSTSSSGSSLDGAPAGTQVMGGSNGS